MAADAVPSAKVEYAPADAPKPPLELGLRMRLSVMMFLQFAVWGAWFTVLGNYLGALKFSGAWVGNIYGTMALGAIVSMMVAGQIADRFVAAEKLMAACHLIGAGLLFAMSQATEPVPFYVAALAYALVYNPTLVLSNSIAFTHVPDAARDFPTLRVLGTIGWIAAGMFVGQVLGAEAGAGADIAKALFGKSLGAGVAASNQPLMLASGVSLLLGLFSLALPHTPPKGGSGDLFPALKAFRLLKDPSFGIFFGLSLAITIALAFYYGFTGQFLGDRGIKDIAGTMTIGQWSEIGFMLALPLALKTLGMKTVLAVGMGAWVVRYGVFSQAGDSFPMLVVGVALHGICFDFFLAAGFIHTDNKAPASIRSSAQALFSFLTYGVGMFIGNVISGFVVDANTTKTVVGGVETAVKNWSVIWLIPAGAAAVCLLAFLALWQDTPGKLEEEGGPAPTEKPAA